MKVKEIVLTLSLTLSVVVWCTSAALTKPLPNQSGENDSGESSNNNSGEQQQGGGISKPKRRGNENSEESENSSEEEDDDSLPKFLIDNLHPNTFPVLNLAYSDAHLAVYVDKGVNRSAKWPYAKVSKAWQYVKKTYGPFAATEDPRLYLQIHSWDVINQVKSCQVNDSRNIIDLKADASNLLEFAAQQMAWLIESSAQSRNFTLLLSKVAKSCSILLYDIYKNTCGKLTAKYLAHMKEGNDLEKEAFIRWYYPIYLNYDGPRAIIKFFKLANENLAAQKSMLCWAEFVHLWSGVVGQDLRLLLSSALQIQVSKQETEIVQKQYPNITYCLGNI